MKGEENWVNKIITDGDTTKRSLHIWMNFYTLKNSLRPLKKFVI